MNGKTYTHNLPTVHISVLRQLEQIEDNYTHHFRDFTTWLTREGREFNETAVRQYIIELNESDYAASTKRIKRQAVKKRIRQLMQTADHDTYTRMETVLKRLDQDFETAAPKINDTSIGRDKIVSDSEFVQLLRHAKSRRQVAFLKFLYVTGCRVGEMCGIKLGHIEKQEKRCIVRVMGKGKKERKVRIPRDLYDFIRDTFRGELYLFETSGVKPYSKSYVSNQIKKIGRRALGRSISAHTMRHSFLTRKVRQYPGLLDAISRYAGHSDPSITLKMYCHNEISDEQLFDSILFE